MGQVRADLQGPEAQARKGPRGAEARPLSPHLGVWRWHITMACSIFHRASGIALYVGALILAGWAMALASGPDAYASYTGLLGTILGKLVLFGLTVAAFYHLASGIRHLVWDSGHGYDPKTSDLTGAACIAFGVVAALAVWLIAFRMGGALMVSYRTGLSRARGLGSAKHGAGHWVVERVTSIALVPLVLWAVYSALILALADYTGASLWISHPVNAVLLSLLIAVSFLHMHAGLRVVIEDYFHTKLNKAVLLLLNLFVCVGAASLAIFCVVKVAVSVAGAPV